MYQILCVFGRGIEKVNGVWQPTQEIERLSEKNGHPGVRTEGICMNGDDPRVVVAGAELNALAAAFFYNRQAIEGFAPRVVVFAAGRPAYIMDDHDQTLTEGRILKEKFVGRAHLLEAGTEIMIQGSNRNTRDDLLQTLFLAKERGLQGIAIISVLVHIARCQEFLKKALEVEPEFRNYGVCFFPAEMILMQLAPEDYGQRLSELLISRAYCRTAERERKGIEDLRAGHYNFGTQGYEFAPAKK